MRRLILVFATLLALTLLLDTESAFSEEGHHSVGIQAGQVGFTGDVGTRYGNALGIGAFFNYAASDFLEFTLSYINSHPSSNNLSMTQNTFELGLQYDIDQFDIFTPYVVGGAEFVTASEDLAVAGVTSSYSATGFGLDIGAGAKVDLGKNFMTGLDFTYHNIFDANVTPTGSSTAVKALQSYFTVMLRFGYAFSSGK